MSISIRTNIDALAALENLRVNGNFQSQTIRRMTSGYRINTAGDDPAGVATANRFRQDTAQLQQGLNNANDGISTLQIIDGGMANISQILDRLKTLAVESASSTFVGDRSVLNDEFQTLLGEINRQAGAIGLNQGGAYATNMPIYIGGNGPDAVVNVDLSTSAMDAASLGLGIAGATSMLATGRANIGTSSAAHSVAKILSDPNNTTPIPNTTTFYFAGPGFSEGNKIAVSVNLQGVTDINSLVAAINTGIQSAAAGSTPEAAAFKASGIVASISTDTTGGQELSFGSNTTAFQVEAGDLVSNAFLGNLAPNGDPTAAESQTADALPLVTTLSGSAAVGVTSGPATVRFMGAGLSSPVDIPLAAGSSTTDLKNQINSNPLLAAAGINASVSAADGSITFTDSRGEGFRVESTGDTSNALGLGTFLSDSAGGVDYTTIQGNAYAVPGGAGTVHLEFSLNGAPSVPVDLNLSGGESGDTVAQMLTNAFASVPALQTAGLTASFSGGNLTISSANNTYFRLNPGTSTTDIGFGTNGAVFSSKLSVAASDSLPLDSSGAAAVGPLSFTPMSYGSDDQSITFSAPDSTGNLQTMVITLRNDDQSRSGQDIDHAIAYLNAQLQANPTLQNIVAVKENVGGVEQIGLLSSLMSFNVGIGTSANGNGLNGGVAVSAASSFLGGSRNLTIDTADGATQAIAAVNAAVGLLGMAQGTVGQGENRLNYALNLAQSQITNYSSAESGIRDADMAAEAANLTKSQILQQATMAAMAQANVSAQAVLTLLKG